jgi:hypothetical protein
LHLRCCLLPVQISFYHFELSLLFVVSSNFVLSIFILHIVVKSDFLLSVCIFRIVAISNFLQFHTKINS